MKVCLRPISLRKKDFNSKGELIRKDYPKVVVDKILEDVFYLDMRKNPSPVAVSLFKSNAFDIVEMKDSILEKTIKTAYRSVEFDTIEEFMRWLYDTDFSFCVDVLDGDSYTFFLNEAEDFSGGKKNDRKKRV